MREIQPKPAPSSSRSLPPLRPDALDRGRPKSRATDPDSHARSHKNTNSISLPPIRPAARGSRDEEHGPLPGISAIILQADANASKQFDPPVPRRSSETSHRVYYNSPIRDQNSARRLGSSSQNHATITQHRRSQESISNLGADGSPSRPSSPDAPSALSSSFASIKTASSLSSILEDRSACGSPPPMLPSFARIEGHPSNTLPPIGGGHVSPRSSVFELSDLRTHLPVDDSTIRVRSTPRSRAALDSPKSTPLPLSRPMSPVGQSNSLNSPKFNLKHGNDDGAQAPSHKKAPSHDKISTNKKSLFVNEALGVKAPSHKDDDGSHNRVQHSHKHDQPPTGGGSPVLSPIKVEFDAIEVPSSPTHRGSKSSLHFFDAKHSRAVTNERPRGLHVNTSDYDQDDTMSSCTPTQTASHSSQLPTRDPSPLSGIESSPVTATGSAPHTPVMRSNSPLAEPSPLTATASSSSSDAGPLSPRLTITSDTDDEDIKPRTAKLSEGGGDGPQNAGADYSKRRTKHRGMLGMMDPMSVETHNLDMAYMGMNPSFGMNMGFGMDMGMGMTGMNVMDNMGGMGGMRPISSVGLGAMGSTGMMGIDPNMGIGATPSMIPTHNPMPVHSAAGLEALEQRAHRMGYTLRPSNDQGWMRPYVAQMPGRGPAQHLARQQLLRQQMAQRDQAIQKLKLEQAQAFAELQWAQSTSQNPEPVLPERTSDISQTLSQLQPISQDDVPFIQQPHLQSQARIQPHVQPQIPYNFDIPYLNDPVPAYTDHRLPSFNTSMHPSLVPPVDISAPVHDPLVAPLTSGLHHTAQEKPHQQPPQPHPQQQITPAATPTAPARLIFRQPTEELSGKDDHTNVGSGAGAHKCDVCGKKFRRPSGLKDHKNIHSGDKPYCCPLETCRKGFATRSNMIRHHNKTHPSRPKIGGVADILGETEEYEVGEHESSPAASTGSGGGGSSSQNRFRVVQQAAGMMDAGGVGPTRGIKDRRAVRKGHPTVIVA